MSAFDGAFPNSPDPAQSAAGNARRRPTKGLLFDKDGTLFDYRATWVPWAKGFISHLSRGDPRLAELIADALEFDQNAGMFRPGSHFIAGTSEQVLNAVLCAVPGLSRDGLERFYYDSTERATLAPPVPLAPLFRNFERNGIRIGLATNDHEEAARRQLSRAGIENCFHFIAGFDSGFGAKPEPGMQHAFCNKVGLQPAEVTMVGDSPHDLLAGRRAGMMTVGVLTGMATREELAAMATAVLNHIGELADWLDLR